MGSAVVIWSQIDSSYLYVPYTCVYTLDPVPLLVPAGCGNFGAAPGKEEPSSPIIMPIKGKTNKRKKITTSKKLIWKEGGNN